jgi:hypothetical protein
MTYIRERHSANVAKQFRAARRQAKTPGPGVVIGNEAPRVFGYVVIETQRPGEPWKVHDQGGNIVVTLAEGLMAQMAIGAVNPYINYLELGDPAPATPPATTDIAMEQTTGERKAVSRTAVGNVAIFEALWLNAEGNGFTFTEGGLFVGVLGAGTLFAHKTFAGIAKNAGFALRITWYITFLVNSQAGEYSGVCLIGPAAYAPKTTYVAAGGENSIAATFDFTPGAYRVLVFMNGALKVPITEYLEADAGLLVPPIGGPAANKGINLVGYTAIPGDTFFLYFLTLA